MLYKPGELHRMAASAQGAIFSRRYSAPTSSACWRASRRRRRRYRRSPRHRSVALPLGDDPGHLAHAFDAGVAPIGLAPPHATRVRAASHLRRNIWPTTAAHARPQMERRGSSSTSRLRRRDDRRLARDHHAAVVVSHTVFRATCDNQRNLTRCQLVVVSCANGRRRRHRFWETAVCGVRPRTSSARSSTPSPRWLRPRRPRSYFDGAVTTGFDTVSCRRHAGMLDAWGGFRRRRFTKILVGVRWCSFFARFLRAVKKSPLSQRRRVAAGTVARPRNRRHGPRLRGRPLSPLPA